MLATKLVVHDFVKETQLPCRRYCECDVKMMYVILEELLLALELLHFERQFVCIVYDTR